MMWPPSMATRSPRKVNAAGRGSVCTGSIQRISAREGVENANETASEAIANAQARKTFMVETPCLQGFHSTAHRVDIGRCSAVMLAGAVGAADCLTWLALAY